MPTQRDKPSNLGEKTEDMPTQRDKPSNLGEQTEDTSELNETNSPILVRKQRTCQLNDTSPPILVYIANLLGKKNGTMFAKRFQYDIILGLNVLPRTQTYPKHTAGAHLFTRDTTARIIRHENLELAKELSNVLDTGCAYVQSKRTFACSFRKSP
ncbi:hypothetical protein TNCV_3212101 [Trichonephila clavipes]|uniref:Uncharacterized protein n=1 Tax=Trichonephila clavipes TaxID=2585209 RepID=A0A8X6SAQ5_TRICX|nr:hypothetical protein TNCV_3212101 [Trichonephila clavipes]